MPSIKYPPNSLPSFFLYADETIHLNYFLHKSLLQTAYWVYCLFVVFSGEGGGLDREKINNSMHDL